MFRHRVFLMVLCLCLPFLLSAEEQKTKPPEDDLKPLQGLWKGSWGGGQGDGVIFQPVLSRIGINGDRVECRGLPFESDGSGTISVSKKGEDKSLQFSYTVKADGQVQKKTVDVPYTVKGDALTLTFRENGECRLLRVTVQQQPLANASVECVLATGINDSDDLLITRYSVLNAAKIEAKYYEPHNQAIPTKDAAIFHVQEGELKKVTVDQARRLLNKQTPVVLTYREDQKAQPSEIWQDTGSAPPDSEPVCKTFAQTLKTETLVFVFSSKSAMIVP